MALIRCKECGKEMSTTAIKCPHCGAEESNTKYILIAVAAFIGLFVIGSIVESLISLVSDRISPPPPIESVKLKEEAQLALAARASEWSASKADIIAKAESALSAGNLPDARNLVMRYVQVAGNDLADLRKRLELAEAERTKQIDFEQTKLALERNKDNQDVRRSLLRHLTEIDPKNPKWKTDLAAVEKRIEADIASQRQKEAARKRKEGVRIGMSQEDVLASNWGRPEKRNISQYSFGTHEQWVYGGGQYLYFENGILKSMQTSR